MISYSRPRSHRGRCFQRCCKACPRIQNQSSWIDFWSSKPRRKVWLVPWLAWSHTPRTSPPCKAVRGCSARWRWECLRVCRPCRTRPLRLNHKKITFDRGFPVVEVGVVSVFLQKSDSADVGDSDGRVLIDAFEVIVVDVEIEHIVFVAFDEEILFVEPAGDERARLAALHVDVGVLYKGRVTREMPVTFVSSSCRVIYINIVQ